MAVDNQTSIDVKKYLVTEKTDYKTFSEEKISDDLSTIKKAEIRSKSKVNIVRNRRDSAVKRAMSALSLKDPFKGF